MLNQENINMFKKGTYALNYSRCTIFKNIAAKLLLKNWIKSTRFGKTLSNQFCETTLVTDDECVYAFLQKRNITTRFQKLQWNLMLLQVFAICKQ